MGIQLERNPLDTTYFMEHIVRDGVGRCAHDFAYALNEITGWKIGVLWQDREKASRKIPVHIFCIAPNGQSVNVEGAKSIDRLKEIYGDPYFRADRKLTFASYNTIVDFSAAMANNTYAQSFRPHDHSIAATRSIIAATPKFLQLLATLKSKSRSNAQTSKILSHSKHRNRPVQIDLFHRAQQAATAPIPCDCAA